MRRSRVTFATIDAAATDIHSASPLMIERTGMGQAGSEIASISRQSGFGMSPARARCMASRVASRIFSRSISCSVAQPMPMLTARFLITTYSCSRSDSESSLESSQPIRRHRLGRTTADATTGPANGPRPVPRSEEHTSELQSQSNLVCRLLLEKKKKKKKMNKEEEYIAQ